MNELEYRAWYKHTKEMLEVLEIRLKTSPYMHLVLADKSPIHYFGVGDNCFLMQYVGFNDKNGKKIFKDDILQDVFGHRMRAVCFTDKSHVISGFTLTPIRDDSLLTGYSVVDSSWLSIAEIIGNVHENPELLNEGKSE